MTDGRMDQENGSMPKLSFQSEGMIKKCSLCLSMTYLKRNHEMCSWIKSFREIRFFQRQRKYKAEQYIKMASRNDGKPQSTWKEKDGVVECSLTKLRECWNSNLGNRHEYISLLIYWYKETGVIVFQKQKINKFIWSLS